MSSDTKLGKRKLDEEDFISGEPLILEPNVLPYNIDNYDDEGFPISNEQNVSFRDPERMVASNIFL